MTIPLDSLDRRLLGEWQRDFPLTPSPFVEIAAALGVTEAEVLARLDRLSATGAVSRIGATIRPNTAGASTLAAIAAPEWRVDEVAAAVGAEPGVNHSYLRECDWNIWFVATGPDRAHVTAALARIGAATGLAVLDLPLARPYHIDLGFSLDGARQTSAPPPRADQVSLVAADRAVLQALSRGLALVPRPFAALAQRLGVSEADLLARIGALATAGIIARIGVILRHRALGWRANAMVVWELPEEEVDGAGMALAAAEGVTLCYRRRPDPQRWPYNLYCMIHARSRDEAMGTLGRAAAEAGIAGLPHRILFSLRCFKQTGAMVLNDREAAA